MQNLPILREYVGISLYIYVPTVTYLQGKKVRNKIQHLENIMVPSVPKDILDKYKKVTLCCDLTYINIIGFLKTISWHVMFATGIMIKYWKIKNIEDGIKYVHKLYLQRGFKITRIYVDRDFEPIRAEMDEFSISLDSASKKEHVPEIEQFNRIVN